MMRGSKLHKGRRLTIWIIVIILLFVFINGFGIQFPQSVSKAVLWPFLKTKEALSTPLGGMTAYFVSKRHLAQENTVLRQRISALEMSLLEEQIRTKDELNELEEKDMSPEGVQAQVLIRPPHSPFDTFVVSIEAEDNVQISDDVFVRGVFIGSVVDTTKTTATIALASTPNKVTVVRIASLDAEAIGKGGGRFTVTIPRDAAVEIEDLVTVPHLGSVIVGIVRDIEDDETGSFKILHFSMPVALAHIQFVTITSGIRFNFEDARIGSEDN